jgi:hypothetical protein
MKTMATQPHRRLMFRWTAPRNLLAILLFVIIAVILQYLTITLAVPAGTSDPATTTIPLVNTSVSLLYHFLPVAMITTLTLCFIHFTHQAATVPVRPQAPKKLPPTSTRQKPTRLKALRQFRRRLRRATQSIKRRILRAPTIAQIQHRITLAKAIIRSAITVAAIFLILAVLLTIAAYPTLVPTATLNLHQWNTMFHGFVMSTIQTSRNVAGFIPPIGAAAAAINSALISASPAFRNTIEGAASALTAGLVALGPVEKYLAIQNIAAWTTAIATLFYSRYSKTRRIRW